MLAYGTRQVHWRKLKIEWWHERNAHKSPEHKDLSIAYHRMKDVMEEVRKAREEERARKYVAACERRAEIIYKEIEMRRKREEARRSP